MIYEMFYLKHVRREYRNCSSQIRTNKDHFDNKIFKPFIHIPKKISQDDK
jgi:hypothetical protein